MKPTNEHAAANPQEKCGHKFYAPGLRRRQSCWKPRGHNGRCASLHAVEPSYVR